MVDATPRRLLLGGGDSLDDVSKLGLERGAADEEAVDVGAGREGGRVGRVGRASVLDADVGGEVSVGGREPVADLLVGRLRLLGGGGHAGADGPDGLVGDDTCVGLEDVLDLLQLRLAHVERLVGVALLERLADAVHDLKALGEGVLELGLEEVVILLEVLPALRVAEDDPRASNVLDLVRGELAGEGAVALEVAVLGGDGDVLLDGADDGGDVEGDGRHDHVAVGAVHAVEGLNEGLGAGNIEVALPVSSDNRLPSHLCDFL
mmetsp:Transcript_4521/g.8869  ORF Transcript_4521/g.8869 Transcript_4521/m.8869 type:complete len:263 (-) Transcript_4521:25-813(-)